MSETRPEIWIPVVVGVVVMLIFIYYCYIKNEEAALRQHQGYIIEKGGGYRRRRGYFPPPPPRRTGLGPLGFAGGDPGDDGNGPPAAGFWGLGGGPPRGGGGGGGCGIMGPGPCARVTRSGRSPFSPSRSRSRAMHPGWYGFRRDSEGPGGRRAWDDLPPLPFGFGGGGGRAGVGMPWTERMLPRRGRGGPWGGGRDGDDDDYDIIERGPAFP